MGAFPLSPLSLSLFLCRAGLKRAFTIEGEYLVWKRAIENGTNVRESGPLGAGGI